jgi:hypothetical protein
MADMAQAEDLVDLKLVDRISHPTQSFISAGISGIAAGKPAVKKRGAELRAG